MDRVVEVSHDREVHRGYMLPSVVRLSYYRRVPHMKVLPHNRNIFLRDGYRCQYCGLEFSHKDLTVDHVHPKSKGGPSTWEKLVACCQPCNRGKANKTPEQAGMVLLRRPRPSGIHTSRHMMRIKGGADPRWQKYLYF
jgi:5-methylcytosine-specific restriction endonuclease McrA